MTPMNTLKFKCAHTWPDQVPEENLSHCEKRYSSLATLLNHNLINYNDTKGNYNLFCPTLSVCLYKATRKLLGCCLK